MEHRTLGLCPPWPCIKRECNFGGEGALGAKSSPLSYKLCNVVQSGALVFIFYKGPVYSVMGQEYSAALQIEQSAFQGQEEKEKKPCFSTLEEKERDLRPSNILLQYNSTKTENKVMFL